MIQFLHQTMTHILKEIIADESKDSDVDGILVFGSYVKHTLHENSDLDIFLLDSTQNNYDQRKKNQQGIIIEFYRWPTHFFQRILYSNSANIYSKAFLFKIIREGNIVYDPKSILKESSIFVKNHEIPQTVICPLLSRTNDSSKLAFEYLNKQRNDLAELEIRNSFENLARLLLLKKKILDINPPKYYLPLLKNTYSYFFTIFCAVHNLQALNPIKIEKNIRQLKTWIQHLLSQHQTRQHQLAHVTVSTSLLNAQTELANAEDCLQKKNLEAAELQTRYASLYLVPLILKQEDKMSTMHQTIPQLLYSNHPYRQVFLSIHNCVKDNKTLRCYLEYLTHLISTLDPLN